MREQKGNCRWDESVLRLSLVAKTLSYPSLIFPNHTSANSTWRHDHFGIQGQDRVLPLVAAVVPCSRKTTILVASMDISSRLPLHHYSSLNPFPLSQSFIHCFLVGDFPPATPPFSHVPSTVSSDHSSTLHVVPFSCPPPKSILISSSLNPSLLHFLLVPSLPFIFSQFLSLFLLCRP